MALNVNSSIFETDEDAYKPKEPKQYTGPDFLVACYDNTGDGNEPLNQWLFRTDSQDDAAAIAELFGGTPVESSHPKYGMAVQSGRDSLTISVLDVSADFQLWVNGNKVHHCDGVRFLSESPMGDAAGDPCRCPKDLKGRKEAAKKGFGPSPHIEIDFQLMDDTELGKGRFKTHSWDLMKALEAYLAAKIQNAMDRGNGEVFAELFIETREYKQWSWRVGMLRDIKPLSEAIAE